MKTKLKAAIRKTASRSKSGGSLTESDKDLFFRVLSIGTIFVFFALLTFLEIEFRKDRYAWASRCTERHSPQACENLLYKVLDKAAEGL